MLKALQTKTATPRTKTCRKGRSRRERVESKKTTRTPDRRLCIQWCVPLGTARSETWWPSGGSPNLLGRQRPTASPGTTFAAAHGNSHYAAPLVPDNNTRRAHNAGSLDDSCEAETGRSWNWQSLEVDDWWWIFFFGVCIDWVLFLKKTYTPHLCCTAKHTEYWF